MIFFNEIPAYSIDELLEHVCQSGSVSGCRWDENELIACINLLSGCLYRTDRRSHMSVPASRFNNQANTVENISVEWKLERALYAVSAALSLPWANTINVQMDSLLGLVLTNFCVGV